MIPDDRYWLICSLSTKMKEIVNAKVAATKYIPREVFKIVMKLIKKKEKFFFVFL